jgi:excisionase family DNA binding protein
MKEVAGYLGCSVAQAYRLANNGAIPSLRVRGMIRTPRRPFLEWMARNTTGGTE